MYPLILIIVFIIPSAIQNDISDSNSVEYVLLDDAKLELERARSAVLRAIQSADINLDSDYERFIVDSYNVQLEGQVVMEYEEQTMYGQVSVVRQLAESAGVDISTCLGNYQDEVNNLTTLSLNKLRSCITTQNVQGQSIISESKNLVDVTINRIESLEVQLNVCKDDNEDCITPIYNIIQWEKLHRPEHIEVQVLRANNLLNRLRVSVQDCSKLYRSQHTNEIGAKLREITKCADDLTS